MNIIIGHSNMDLDCIGSLVLAGYLYPDYRIIRSRLVHPVAKNVLNLYKRQLDFDYPKDLKGVNIDKVVVVDTRTTNRIKECFEFSDYTINDVEEVVIYDHHEADCCDIERATLISEPLGANVSILVKKLKERDIKISPEDATIALAGIYGDTGSFTFDSVTTDDFEAASWLLSQGAILNIVKKFLKPMKEEAQIDIFHTVMNRLETKKILGHFILLSHITLPKQFPGIGAVVEKVMDVENPDAFFLVVAIEKGKQTLIIGRSQMDRISICDLLKVYGGGGHTQAASAKLKGFKDPNFLDELIWHLKCSLIPSISAGVLMTPKVYTIQDTCTLLEASVYLEKIQHTGCPVVDDDNELVGVLTLRDISKGRKAGQMNAPVKSYMSKKVETFTLDSSVREIENTFFSKNIGHIPVVSEKRVVGIVTRQDFLDFINKSREVIV